MEPRANRTSWRFVWYRRLGKKAATTSFWPRAAISFHDFARLNQKCGICGSVVQDHTHERAIDLRSLVVFDAAFFTRCRLIYSGLYRNSWQRYSCLMLCLDPEVTFPINWLRKRLASTLEEVHMTNR